MIDGFEVDRTGYVYSLPWRTKLFRLAGPGVIMVWDKGAKQERPITLTDLAELWGEYIKAHIKQG